MENPRQIYKKAQPQIEYGTISQVTSFKYLEEMIELKEPHRMISFFQECTLFYVQNIEIITLITTVA